jgi:hypothetical protein
MGSLKENKKLLIAQRELSLFLRTVTYFCFLYIQKKKQVLFIANLQGIFNVLGKNISFENELLSRTLNILCCSFNFMQWDLLFLFQK